MWPLLRNPLPGESRKKKKQKREREIPEKRSKQSQLLLTAFPIEPSPTEIGRTQPVREKRRETFVNGELRAHRDNDCGGGLKEHLCCACAHRTHRLVALRGFQFILLVCYFQKD